MFCPFPGLAVKGASPPGTFGLMGGAGELKGLPVPPFPKMYCFSPEKCYF